MVSLMTYLFIVFMEMTWKFLRYMGRLTVLVFKVIGWMMFVPVIDIVMLIIWGLITVIRLIFKKSIPRIAHTKYWVVYPSLS